MESGLEGEKKERERERKRERGIERGEEIEKQGVREEMTGK